MEEGQHEKWLAERRKGVGGSDVASVLYEPPYGCARRLAYEKREVAPDFPIEDKLIYQRGKWLEPAAAERYKDETGRILIQRSTLVDSGKPWRRVNTDREIFVVDTDDPMAGRGPGVLEIKTANASAYAKIKREGMPAGYIWQVQWGIAITGREWGSFVVLHPDSWRVIIFDVERDDEMIEHLYEAVDKFWHEVEDGPLPPQIAHDDNRCQRCEWRITCHGTAAPLLAPAERSDLVEMEEIAGVLADYRDAKALADDVNDTLEMAKDRLKDALGGMTAVSCHGAKVYYRPSVQKRISPELLRKRHPQIAAECTVETQIQALRVFLPGGESHG